MRIKTLIFYLIVFSTCIIAQSRSERGSFFFDANSPDYKLNKGEGDRTVELQIKYKEPFDINPAIFMSITVLDLKLEDQNDLRYGVEAVYQTREGFVLRVKVWGDTKLNGIGGYWDASSK